MSNEFQREYLLRLPLPLAQLYGRAYNAKDGRGRHDNCFYLCEALIKLAAGPMIVAYLDEIRRDGRRVESIDRLLVQRARLNVRFCLKADIQRATFNVRYWG